MSSQGTDRTDLERVAAFLEGRLKPEEHQRFIVRIAREQHLYELVASVSRQRGRAFRRQAMKTDFD